MPENIFLKKFLPSVIILVIVIFTIPGRAAATANAIFTFHYDNFRTGWNRHQTTLTPANVGNLELLHAVPLDEQINAQPLFVPGVTIAGGTHSVVYVATANDTVYAIDAESGAVLLQVSLGPPVPESALPGQCNNNSGVVGITSTPVIDRAASTIYVMAYTYQGGTPAYSLHALDLGTLADKTTPTVAAASATLTDGSQWNFSAANARQRAALLEANGNIYAGFSSFCDIDASQSRGWVLGWQAGSLAPLGANRLNNKLLPNQSPSDFFLSSIWMSGNGLAADRPGNLYFVTGNSDPSGTTYSPTGNLSESVVEMRSDLTRVMNYFSPTGADDVSVLDQDDEDFGSGGVLILPAQPGGWYLATAAGKAGNMYLLDRHHLGGHRTSNPGAFGTYSIGNCWCGQSYFVGWDGTPRVVSSGGKQIIVWRLATSPSVSLIQESTSPELPASVQDPGFFTSVSSNGTQNALIWAVGRPVDSNPANVTLYAFDPQAAAEGSKAWLFSGVAGTWPNTEGNADIVPVVTDGRVFVASYKELAIFGMPPAGAVSAAAAVLPSAPAAAPPAAKLPPGGHEIFGTITNVTGSVVTVATRTGTLVRINAAPAARADASVVLRSGERVRVLGRYDRAGVIEASSIIRAKTSPKGWPPDR